MLDRLLQALVASENEAADDVLLEALTLGNETEKAEQGFHVDPGLTENVGRMLRRISGGGHQKSVAAKAGSRAGNGLVPGAGHEMVVYHPGGLHEGVADG